MRQFLLFLLLLCASLPATQAQTKSQQSERPFAGHYFCEETGVHIFLNLYDAVLEAPNFSFLGKMNGYMNGDIYGTWMTTAHQIKDNKATIRFINDIGSDTQTIDFTQVNDSTFTYRAVNGNAIRRAVGRKLVKITGNMTFIKQPD